MRLAEYLEKNKLGYSDFAAALRLNKKTGYLNVWRWAKGERDPRPEIAFKINKITKGQVTLDDLYATNSGQSQ